MSHLFGTDGIRGRAGSPPLDPASVGRIGRAFARVLRRELGRPPSVVLGRDTRESGPAIQACLAAGLRAEGSAVRSAGVIPTPAISLLTRTGHGDAGVMVSASHNPFEDNGLKFFGPEGTKLSDELEAAIEGELSRVPEGAPAGRATGDEPELAAHYGDWLVERGTALGARLSGLTLCVDTANGAASEVAPRVLRRLGARVHPLSARPDGRNINDGCGSLHPEGLLREVAATGADAGIAFDGDADRALLADDAGSVVDGDAILFVTAHRWASEGRLRGRTVVGTLMSNFGLEAALAELGVRLDRAPVGDRFVLERMRATGSNLGGEPSGHLIFLDEAPTGDGILTALQVLATVVHARRSLSSLTERFRRTPQVLLAVRVAERVPLDRVKGYGRLAATWSKRLAAEGRFVVRYSGTEPLLRVMAEGRDPALVQACASELAEHLERTLGAGRA